MKTIFMGVDLGLHTVKSSTGLILRSAIEECKNQNPNAKLVKYKDTIYELGNEGNNTQLIENAHLIQCLYLIGKEMSELKIFRSKVVLGIGYPVTSEDSMINYMRFFKDEESNFTFEYKDVEFRCDIVAYCFPNGLAGFLYHHDSMKSYREVNLIDIRSRTVDFLMISLDKVVLSTAKSINFSMDNFISKTLMEIKNRYEVDITRNKLQLYMSGNESNLDGDIKRIINRRCVDLVHKFIEILSKNGCNVKKPSFIIGGAAESFERILDVIQSNRIGSYFVPDNMQFSNALGLKLLAQEAYRRYYYE